MFDEFGNVTSTFKGENGQELQASCKAGAHQAEFLKDARLMLEDRNLKDETGKDVSSEQRAALLYKLLVNNETKQQIADVTLDSIRNLDLKDLNFIKGYHFADLSIDNCRFENCSFDVSGSVFANNSTFVGGLIHGNRGTQENPTALSFVGMGLRSEGLQITGMFKDSMFLIKNKTSASQIIALEMDGELPTFLPDGTKFNYKTKAGAIRGHDIAKELAEAKTAEDRAKVVERIKNDANAMTDESRTALSNAIKENLEGLVVSLDDRNKDVFYAILKENCVSFAGNIASVMGTKFDPTKLFETVGIATDYTLASPSDPVASLLNSAGAMSAKEINISGLPTKYYVVDDDWTKIYKFDPTPVGWFNKKPKGWGVVDPAEKQQIFKDFEHVGAVCA